MLPCSFEDPQKSYAGVCLQSDNRPEENLRSNIRNFPTNKKGNSLKFIQPRKLLKIFRLEEAIEEKNAKSLQ